MRARERKRGEEGEGNRTEGNNWGNLERGWEKERKEKRERMREMRNCEWERKEMWE